MRKYIILPLIALLFIGLTLSSGCLKKSEVKETPKNVFAGGTEGLAISFQPGMPPSEVFEGSSFSIGIKVENKGEYEVAAENAKIYLSGIDPEAWDKTSSDFEIEITDDLTPVQKIGDTITPGAIVVPTVSDLKYIRDIPGDTDFTLVAKACYNYQTVAMSSICIKENPFVQTTGAPEICKVTGTKPVYNWGSPVHVESVEEIPMGVGEKVKLGFQIKIKNVGTGYTYTKPDCTTLGASDINKLKVTATMGSLNGTISRECNNKEVLLVDDEATVLCSFEIEPAAEEYEDILFIKLDYGYAQQITKKIKLRNVPGYMPEEVL